MILQTKFHIITQRESERERERERDLVSTSTTHFRNDRAAAECECVIEFTQECWIIVTLSCCDYYYDNHGDSNCIRTKQFPHAVVSNRTFLVTEIKSWKCTQHYSLLRKFATILPTIWMCWIIGSINYKLYIKRKSDKSVVIQIWSAT